MTVQRATYHRLFVDGVKTDDVDSDFHFCRAICTTKQLIKAYENLYSPEIHPVANIREHREKLN